MYPATVPLGLVAHQSVVNTQEIGTDSDYRHLANSTLVEYNSHPVSVAAILLSDFLAAIFKFTMKHRVMGDGCIITVHHEDYDRDEIFVWATDIPRHAHRVDRRVIRFRSIGCTTGSELKRFGWLRKHVVARIGVDKTARYQTTAIRNFLYRQMILSFLLGYHGDPTTIGQFADLRRYRISAFTWLTFDEKWLDLTVIFRSIRNRCPGIVKNNDHLVFILRPRHRHVLRSNLFRLDFNCRLRRYFRYRIDLPPKN